MFEALEKTLQKQQLYVTIDKIRKRYGFKSLRGMATIRNKSAKNYQ